MCSKLKNQNATFATSEKMLHLLQKNKKIVIKKDTKVRVKKKEWIFKKIFWILRKS